MLISSVEAEVVLDFVGASRVDSPRQSCHFLASLEIDRVHPQRRNESQNYACDIPIVPFDPVFVHQVISARKSTLCKLGHLNAVCETPTQLQSTSHRHFRGQAPCTLR